MPNSRQKEQDSEAAKFNTYLVEEIHLNGKEAEKWKVIQLRNSTDPDALYLEDYLGHEKHIILPISINGKKITEISEFSFKKCVAEHVEIPGYYTHIPKSMFSDNLNIRELTLGEGVRSIDDGAYMNSANLSIVRASKSINWIIDEWAFVGTKWMSEYKDDQLIIGRVLYKHYGNKETIHMLPGITTIASSVLVNTDRVREVVIPDGVTHICSHAFLNGNFMRSKPSLVETFVIPKSVIYIGYEAFHGTKWFEQRKNEQIIINNIMYHDPNPSNEVVFPPGIVRVDAAAYDRNRELVRIQFPESLKIIGRSSFSGCVNLVYVSFPNQLEKISDFSFYSCKSLKHLEFPDSLVTIGARAFCSCSNLKEVVMGKSTKTIGASAFKDCQRLKLFCINQGLIQIGESAFENCKALNGIELPESLTELGASSFYGCRRLSSIQIPDNIDRVSANTFSGCANLKTVILPPDTKEIGQHAFFNCEKLKTIKMPPVIGDQAFEGCKELDNVDLSEHMTLIARGTFKNCTSLTSIKIPEGVTSIEREAFMGCENLATVELPTTLQTIGRSSFANCYALSAISIPKSVTVIQDQAFENCRMLTDVDLPASTEILGLHAFSGTNYIKKEHGDFVVQDGILVKYTGSDTDVTIPDDVTSIAENAFSESSEVITIKLPDSVKTINKHVMGHQRYRSDSNSKLETLILGDGVKQLCDFAFKGCENLTEVVFGQAVQTIGESAFGDIKLTEIDLSKSSVREINSFAFSYCSNLKSVIFPETLETIDGYSFDSTKLNVVYLPKSVKKVGKFAFSGCIEMVVYDTIDPEAIEASEYVPSEHDDPVNSSLAYAGGDDSRQYHITVLSAETNTIKFRIFCDYTDNARYSLFLRSAWGKHASFKFYEYDELFLVVKSAKTRAEIAFCRMQYPYEMSDKHKDMYESYLMQSLYNKRSAKRIIEVIAEANDVDRIKLLERYELINERNVLMIKEEMSKTKSRKCKNYMKKHYS